MSSRSSSPAVRLASLTASLSAAQGRPQPIICGSRAMAQLRGVALLRDRGPAPEISFLVAPEAAQLLKAWWVPEALRTLGAAGNCTAGTDALSAAVQI